MQAEVKSIVIANKSASPHFKCVTQTKTFAKSAIVVKVLAFSLDPVMRVWLSGAKTNFRTVTQGEVFNCFGLGQIIQSQDDTYKVGTYIFGNTGTRNYFQLDSSRMKQCFEIDTELIKQWGPFKFLYLINNGLAAYRGYQVLEVKEGENVVVSTAAGATGLLLCHLLKKKKANIIAISSEKKKPFLQPYTNKVIDYTNQAILLQELKNLKFSKYFDNVGDSMLDLILTKIQNNGIVALCGAIQSYLHPKEGGIANYGLATSKRLKIQGVNFSTLLPRAKQIFEEFKEATLLLKVQKIANFNTLFDQLYVKGGSIVGKVIIDPHL